MRVLQSGPGRSPDINSDISTNPR